MTDRLYYENPYSRAFDAAILRIELSAGHQLVWLDRTAFYPTSGGQPFDTGTLGSYRVVDVYEDDDAHIVHVVKSSTGAVGLAAGEHVHGEIDWARRFDHMQQHTGQHVLSAAIDRLFGVRTVSFHLGSDAATIDVARELTPHELVASEDEANRIVWEDRPVTIRYTTPEQAAGLTLRKPPARAGTLRLIDIEDYDLSACGGTHVGRTGAIGVIAFGACERFKGGQRIEFFCGGRALGRFRVLRGATGASTKLLSVLPADLPAAIERMQAAAKDQKRQMLSLQQEVARNRAVQLASEAEPYTHYRVLLRTIEGDIDTLKALASAVVIQPGLLVVLVSAHAPAVVVVARSADVPVSARDLVAVLTQESGGRGGGRPEFAQAGGLAAEPAAILAAARAAIISSAQ